MKREKKFEIYRTQRLAAKKLWTKIFGSAERKHLVKAAKMLGMWEEPNQLLAENEFEFDVFTEFYLFNYKIKGKSPVEIYASAHSPANEVEQMVLESGVISKASLFTIDKINPKERTVIILDLLNLEEEYEYMDFTMSQHPELEGCLLFTRLLLLPQVNMLTGSTLPFPPGFSREYRRLFYKLGKKIKTKDKETKRFQIFWELYQRYGLPMENVEFT